MQSDVLRRLPTRFVLPLEPEHDALLIDPHLNPTFIIDGQRMILLPQLAGTVRARDLGSKIGSLSGDGDRLEVQRALELLISGL